MHRGSSTCTPSQNGKASAILAQTPTSYHSVQRHLASSPRTGIQSTSTSTTRERFEAARPRTGLEAAEKKQTRWCDREGHLERAMSLVERLAIRFVFLDGRGVDEGLLLISDRNWGACMITLRRSSCWVLAGVGSMLPPFSALFKKSMRLTSTRSCLLHRFVKDEWRILSSQTIGVEFASKIIRVGTGARRKRIKLQVFPLPLFSKVELTRPALGYSRHRTLPLRITLLLSRCCRRNTSLRHHLPPNLHLSLLLPQRRPRPRIPEPHSPPRRQ
jgi:hypothetical protein